MSMDLAENTPTAEELPSLPRDEDGPVFQEPWQAQAFAMTLALHAQGQFTWPEWAERLGAEISAAQANGDPDLGDTYYLHWLNALESMVASKGIVSTDDLALRKEAWDHAAHITPHGQPIVLPKVG
ncbi:MAG: nitrile hydratase accessory protein [Alphaproteobacteria bacterium]|nr:nitrile hydratase accessory protein [Alphaproteobacteria bacterium]